LRTDTKHKATSLFSLTLNFK